MDLNNYKAVQSELPDVPVNFGEGFYNVIGGEINGKKVILVSG